MKFRRYLYLCLVVIISITLISCMNDDGDDDSSKSSSDDDGITFSSSDFFGDFQGILAEQSSVTNNQTPDISNSTITVHAADPDPCLDATTGVKEKFCDPWNDNISTMYNSDSLMGFLNDQLVSTGEALEDIKWTNQTSGAGILNIYGMTFNIFTKILSPEKGWASKIYFLTNQVPNPDWSTIDVNSSSSIVDNDHGYMILTLKENDDEKSFSWVQMSKYGDDANSVWDTTADDFIQYKRNNDEEDPRILPSVNRCKDCFDGGRAVLGRLDKVKNEMHFEHLTSTEKHNRQEHYAIKLTGIDNSDGTFAINESSSINYLAVIRAYFSTTIGDQEVNLVNDADSEKVNWFALQGKVRTGMRFQYRLSTNKGENWDSSGDVCIKMNESLDPADITTNAATCDGSTINFPAITDNFTTYKGSPSQYAYLPTTGETTGDGTSTPLDLRINLFSLYDDNYDISWIADLPVTN